MTDKDSLGERGRALEEEYFRKKNQELVERMRRAAEADQARTRLGQTTGLTDPALLKDMEELGFTADTVSLLPLVPLLQMAWAEGGVSSDERRLILQLARSRGIAEGSPADRQLTAWLETRPDEAVFARAGRLIVAVLEAGAPGAGGLTADDVVQQAEKIAAASGGFLGLGRISAEEKSLLARIADELHARRK